MKKWIVLMIISGIFLLGAIGVALPGDGKFNLANILGFVIWLAVFLWANQKRKEKSTKADDKKF